MFVAPKPSLENATEEELDRLIFVLRKRASHEIPAPGKRFYICSFSRRIVVYKGEHKKSHVLDKSSVWSSGQLTSDQLWVYFPDLADPLYDTYLALVHTRFSTNTFPSWERAHPLRYVVINKKIKL